MQKNIRSLLLIMVGVGLPHVLFAQATLFTILSMLVVVFTSLIRVGLAIALVVFMWGLVMFIAQSGNEQAREVGKKRMLWGIVALFMIVSLWGVIALLADISGVTGASTTQPAPIITY